VIHILRHGLALCGMGPPSGWPTADRWVGVDDLQAPTLATCADCLRGVTPIGPRTVHLTSAALLPPIDHAPGRFTQRLAAMARPPRWVIDITSGRPAHAFAEGAEVELMHSAIAERANPLLSQGGSAWAAYAAALDARWSAAVDRHDFDPGTWHYLKHGTTWGRDGYPRGRIPGEAIGGPVPNGCYLACTCRPHEGCHIQILAPHLVRAGWSVTLYGVPVR